MKNKISSAAYPGWIFRGVITHNYICLRSLILRVYLIYSGIRTVSHSLSFPWKFIKYQIFYHLPVSCSQVTNRNFSQELFWDRFQMKEQLTDSYDLFLKYAEKTLVKLKRSLFHQEVYWISLKTWFCQLVLVFTYQLALVFKLSLGDTILAISCIFPSDGYSYHDIIICTAWPMGRNGSFFSENKQF